MKIFKKLLVAPLFFLIAMPTFAHQYGNHGISSFDKRIERQKSRIKQGVKSGELTRKEAKSLRNQQKKIAKLDRKFTSDGKLSKHERHKLKKRLDKASKRIYRLKHNDKIRHGKRDSFKSWHHKHNHHSRHLDQYRFRSRYYDDYEWPLIIRLSGFF